MPNTATRLINLIMLLQRRPNQQAADLAAELGVSVRTLHRYMTMLDELGIPICSERGPQGGFSLVRGYRMPPLVFTPAEAAALCLGADLVGDLWAKLYSEAARGARAKLENLLPADQLAEVAWARKTLVSGSLRHTGLDPYAPLLDTLRTAIRTLRRVQLVYQGTAQPEAQARAVDPYAIAYHRGWWYLIGYCHLRQAVRVFRVDRIQQLSLLPATYAIPLDFDARAHLDFEFQSDTPIPIRLQFAPQFAYLVTNTPAAWELITPQDDGSVIAAATMPDLYWAAIFTLSYGPAVTVLEPDSLRGLMRTWATEIAAKYGP